MTCPVQRLTDFVKGEVSSSVPPSSYRLGVKSAALHDIYPKPLYNAFVNAITHHFDKQMVSTMYTRVAHMNQHHGAIPQHPNITSLQLFSLDSYVKRHFCMVSKRGRRVHYGYFETRILFKLVA